MLKDLDKEIIRKVISEKRPDLQKQLLQDSCYIYDRMEKGFRDKKISDINRKNIESVWMQTNLENPIPDLTAELDAIFDSQFSELKSELIGLAMYKSLLIDIAESDSCMEVYDDYKYFSDEFAYSNEFESDLIKVIENHLQNAEYI